MFVFKIRNTETSLYSNGGSKPTFSKTGKSWTSIGHLQNHITKIKKSRKSYTSCEAVRFKLIEDDYVDLDLPGIDIAHSLKEFRVPKESFSLPNTISEITEEDIEMARKSLDDQIDSVFPLAGVPV